MSKAMAALIAWIEQAPKREAWLTRQQGRTRCYRQLMLLIEGVEQRGFNPLRFELSRPYYDRLRSLEGWQGGAPALLIGVPFVVVEDNQFDSRLVGRRTALGKTEFFTYTMNDLDWTAQA